jgi:hypothetical protein
MARAANDASSEAAARVGPHRDSPEGGQATGSHGGCPVAWCPICLTVTTVQPMKPELVEHLLKAGTEMLLALRAVVDARADEMTVEGSGRSKGASSLEKIDLD